MASLRLFFDLPLTAVQGGWLTMIIGLVALMPIIRTERGRQLFYERPADEEEGDVRIGCLWVLPFIIMILAAVAWWWLFVLTW